MSTLIDYAETHFPNHATESLAADVTLTQHTAVAHVLNPSDAARIERELRSQIPGASVATVLIHPTEPTLMKNGGEDNEGVIDLPRRRVAISGILGGIVVGVVVGVLVWLVVDSIATAIIVALFAAVVGGASAAMIGGGARFGGERAWEQPNRPDATVALVAAFMDEESSATEAATVMEAMHPHDVRIVGADGAWHSPHT